MAAGCGARVRDSRIDLVSPLTAHMAWFKHKPDPISDRAKALNAEIAKLEAEIHRLDSAVKRAPAPPQRPTFGSTVRPNGYSANEERPPSPSRKEVVFEDLEQPPLNLVEREESEAHFNDLGVRKYDLPALLRRVKNHLRGPATTNPKLVSYLAAGGIQGLRPLRYERRVARNRFVVLVTVLFLMLLGLIWFFVSHPR